MNRASALRIVPITTGSVAAEASSKTIVVTESQ
jgi:hypothetical protein